MRIVLDTNVLIAAFIARGTCCEVFEHIIRYHDLIVSEFIIEEFRNNLVGKFHFQTKETSDAIQLWLKRAQTVEIPLVVPHLCSDPDDDNIIATAVVGRCDCIVTGDKDLLSLKSTLEIQIIRPNEFWQFESMLGGVK